MKPKDFMSKNARETDVGFPYWYDAEEVEKQLLKHGEKINRLRADRTRLILALKLALSSDQPSQETICKFSKEGRFPGCPYDFHYYDPSDDDNEQCGKCWFAFVLHRAGFGREEITSILEEETL